MAFNDTFQYPNGDLVGNGSWVNPTGDLAAAQSCTLQVLTHTIILPVNGNSAAVILPAGVGINMNAAWQMSYGVKFGGNRGNDSFIGFGDLNAPINLLNWSADHSDIPANKNEAVLADQNGQSDSTLYFDASWNAFHTVSMIFTGTTSHALCDGISLLDRALASPSLVTNRQAAIYLEQDVGVPTWTINAFGLENTANLFLYVERFASRSVGDLPGQSPWQTSTIGASDYITATTPTANGTYGNELTAIHVADGSTTETDSENPTSTLAWDVSQDFSWGLQLRLPGLTNGGDNAVSIYIDNAYNFSLSVNYNNSLVGNPRIILSGPDGESIAYNATISASIYHAICVTKVGAITSLVVDGITRASSSTFDWTVAIATPNLLTLDHFFDANNASASVHVRNITIQGTMFYVQNVVAVKSAANVTVSWNAFSSINATANNYAVSIDGGAFGATQAGLTYTHVGASGTSHTYTVQAYQGPSLLAQGSATYTAAAPVGSGQSAANLLVLNVL